MQSIHLILIGDELLSGKRQDRHLQFLAEGLTRHGARVESCQVIRDVPGAVSSSVAGHLAPGAVIVTTGGLGPTQDDLTREGIGEATGVGLRPDEDLWEDLKKRFERAGRKISPSNRSQALVPEKGTFFANHHGTAPGLVFEPEEFPGACVVALPGPPRELQPMWENQALPYLAKKCQWPDPPISLLLRFCLIGESSIDEKLRPILDPYPEIDLSSLFSLGRVDVTLSLPADYPGGPDLLRDIGNQVGRLFGSYVYVVQEKFSNESVALINLEEVVRDLLLAKKEKLAVAESCTGGWLAKALTDFPESSQVFLGGWVAYDNELKMRELGVQSETLETHGAVSEETAREMVAGVLEKSGADWGLSITGIAGPGGGTEEKPVGLVFVGIGNRDGLEVHRYEFPGNREMIRERSVVAALRLLWLQVHGNEQV